jgi:hypothetical protein
VLQKPGSSPLTAAHSAPRVFCCAGLAALAPIFAAATKITKAVLVDIKAGKTGFGALAKVRASVDRFPLMSRARGVPSSAQLLVPLASPSLALQPDTS